VMASPTRGHSYLRNSSEQVSGEQSVFSITPSWNKRDVRTKSTMSTEQAKCSRDWHGSYHSEQGHSPDRASTYSEGLNPKELRRARKRFIHNKGCQYQSCTSSRQIGTKVLPDGCRDWLPGQNQPHPEGGTIFPWPCTLNGVLWKKAKENRREGWGGLASRRDYHPVFVPQYRESSKGNMKKLDAETLQKCRVECQIKQQHKHKKERQLRGSGNKQWLPPPTCYDPEVITNAHGELGPMGNLAPAGWWVSRDPTVLTAPHHFHQDQTEE